MSNPALWLLFNPVAGHGRAARLLPAVTSRLAAAGYDVTVAQTAGPNKAADQVRWIVQHQPAATIAVLGGDGTVHEAISGFLDTQGAALWPESRLAILNAGTGGDFARGLGLARDPMQAIANLAQARPKPIDLGWIQCMGLDGRPVARAFINIADVGLAGDVVSRVNRTTKVFGGFASFLWGTLASLATVQAKAMDVTVDDEAPVSGRWVMLSVANGRYFGGGMALCPVADPGDGRFDLVELGDLSRVQLYAKFPHIYKGSHLSLPGVHHRTIKTLRVTTPEPVWMEADGELIGTTPATIRVVPAALHVLV